NRKDLVMLSASLSLVALFCAIAIAASFFVLVHDVIEWFVLRGQDRLASASLASKPVPYRWLPLLFLGGVFTRRNVVVVSSRRLALRHLSAPLRVVMLLLGKVVVFVDDETGPEFMENVVFKARFDRCILVRNALGQYPARSASIA